MLGEADEKCLDTWAARDKGEEKEEERGAVEVGGASVADVRQTRREAVEVALPSRANGGQIIGCVGNAFKAFFQFYLVFLTQNLKLYLHSPGYKLRCVVVLPLVPEVCMKKKLKKTWFRKSACLWPTRIRLISRLDQLWLYIVYN